MIIFMQRQHASFLPCHAMRNKILTLCPASAWSVRVASLALLSFLAIFAFASWPLDVLHITLDGETLFSAPAPLGQTYTTRIIHSLERSPVEDEYRLVGGSIWTWQERVQSHNAGLPFGPPPHGRFYSATPWMVVEGGRQAFASIAYRVGTQELGHNEFRFGNGQWHSLYRTYPEQRLFFSLKRQNIFSFSWKPFK